MVVAKARAEDRHEEQLRPCRLPDVARIRLRTREEVVGRGEHMHVAQLRAQRKAGKRAALRCCGLRHVAASAHLAARVLVGSGQFVHIQRRLACAARHA
eukprot:scaffold93708_cov72-Phaeocystis_antarctica.AAC.7